ncbi:MAG: copper homeostasis protein CutC [Bacteroidaceae bacterium]|nr:copper homeostasis protein CutC [Bacteroidaceae bacterium]
MILEVCCGNIQSVRAAVEGGAQRVELCRDLELDGLTPDRQMISQAIAICHPAGVRVYALVRPRAGDFVYSAAEMEQMLADIRMAVELGADGIVIGALTADGAIDIVQTEQMIRYARQCCGDRQLGVTFHRAFDVCNNPFQALEQIIRLGCDRILTSGQQPTAEQGIPLLKELVRKANGRIIILCGAGVTPANAARILHETGATELHGSLRTGPITDPEKVTWLIHNA